MKRTDPFRRALALAALATVLVLGATACGSDDDSSGGTTTTTAADGSSTTAGSDAEASDELPDKITIAYQAIPNGDLIVKQQGLLEKALPDTQIEWKIFDSGGAVNEAVAAGNIDLGLAGSSPVARGVSAGLDYRVVWIHNVIGEAEALVVRDDISSIEDLAGKKIATPFASTAHYSLLGALDNAGVDPSTVNIIDSEPADIVAAWSRGDIDGAYVWNPSLATLIADGGNVLITSADLAELGSTTYDLGIASNSFADQYPAAVEAWVKVQDEAVALLNEDPEAAAEIIAVELNITPEEALDQLGDLIFVSAADQAGEDHLGGALAQALLRTAEFNLEQGQIDAVKEAEAYEAAVDPSFAAAVGG